MALSATAGFDSYLWNTGSTSPIIITGTAGTYSCTAVDLSTTVNLVMNGDFSQGATGFSSDYLPGTGGSYGLLSLEGHYAVASNPHDTHVNFASFGDHTSGNGPMLVVNGASVPDQDIWCTSVAVTPNTDYAFSSWLASVTPGAPAILDFTVNGASLGSPLLASPVTGQWLPFHGLWNSGNATSATICISNQNTAIAGNDFALDDIVFSPICTYTDQVVVTVQPYPQPDLGPDLTTCADESVTLSPSWPAATGYLWSDGSTAPTLTPSFSGIQWVDVTENGCTTRDSISVTINPLPVVDLGPDQILCAGESATLNAFQPGASYLWQDGSTGSGFTATTALDASVSVTILGCSAGDAASISFIPLPVVDLGADALICPDSMLVFDATQPGGSYLWDDGGTSPQHGISTEGTHWLSVTVDGCSSSDSLLVRIIPPIDLHLGPDFVLCTGTTATLDAGLQPGPGLHYLWNNGSTMPDRQVDDGGLYSVLVTNSCGMAADSIRVTKARCDCPVFIPNSFTPDGDGLNDGFAPVFDCPVADYELMVFDRWGQMIWGSTAPHAAWDGTSGGAPVPQGIYEWLLSMTPRTYQDNVPHRRAGYVLVLR